MSEEVIINDEVLLQHICNYEPLYKKSNPGYKSVLQKENCWQSVYKNLKLPVAAVKARFKSLREKYRREIAIENSLSRSGAGLNIRPHWPLMSFFKFMNEDTTGRETTSNFLSDIEDNTNTQEIYVVENIDSPSDINNYIIGDGDSSASQSNISIIEDKPTTVTQTRNKRKKQISNNTEEGEVDSILTTVSKAISCINETPKKRNKVENFSIYLVSELEAFPPIDAELFMDEVVNNLIKYKQELRQRDNLY
ncbi:hypothetical protein NQ314_011599 [Rhamnusium bicolor]|uniref:MADF domain-containing protein n=1 Tax=Rhamnusium bicolor TaxID=1586634 RepID=A0AAV8XJ48_9CUCU|nr:hypothetical protein NQ314_011599 [Rhamnusium bicolor]